MNGPLLSGAIVITLIASLESIAIAKALGARHKQPDLDANREYIALGLANFFGSFAGAYPLSGSFSRSALNDDVGATSPMAMLTVAVLVGIILKIASTVPIFYYLPANALAAIVITALINLMDWDHFFWLAQYDRKDALLWATAFIGVLFTGVEIGILIAVVTSLGLVVAETLFAPMPQLGLVPGSTRRAFRSMRQYPNAAAVPGVLVFRVESPIIFANTPTVISTLRRVVYGGDGAAEGEQVSGVRAVVLDMSNVPYVDSAFLESFEDLINQYKRAEVLLCLANPNSTVLHKLTITPLLEALNTQFGDKRDWVFITARAAAECVCVCVCTFAAR